MHVCSIKPDTVSYCSPSYSLLIEDNVIKHVNMDPDSSGLACLLCIRNMKSGVEQAVGS